MASNFLKPWYEKSGISFLEISTGDLIRKTIETETHISQEMLRINKAGLRQPPIVAGALWFSEIISKLHPGQRIIHEGSPRSAEELQMMLSLIEINYLSSIKIVEIESDSDALCLERLIERTKKDKRIDLSVDEKPGVPDIGKIKRKLSWWSDNRDEIVQAAKKAHVYIRVRNTSTPQAFESVLAEEFGFFELYKV